MLSLSLALFLMAAPNECGACSVRAEKVTLCADHTREEQLVLKRERRNFEKADTDEQKVAALRAIAALTEAHTNAPSPAVPKVLAMGLADPSDVVGAETLALFAPPQNPQAALDVLLDLRRDFLPRAKLDVPAPGRGLKTVGDLKKLGRDSAQAMTQAQEARPFIRAIAGIERHLVHLPDERVTKALREDLSLPSSAALTLASLGAQTTLEPLRRALEAYGEPLPVTWPPARDGSRSDAPHPGAELIAALEALAARHGLAPVPEEQRLSSKEWSLWLAANRASFPERLPGVGALPAAR